MNFNEEAAAVHAEHARWWRDPKTGKPIERNADQLLMLIVSELAEAMEGARKDLMDDHLPKRKMVEVEMADALIRILDMCGARKIPIELSQRELQPLPDDPAAALFFIVKQIASVGSIIASGADVSYEGRAMSNVIKAIMMFGDKFHLDIKWAMVEKRKYNLTRLDHSDEARLAKGGKKW